MSPADMERRLLDLERKLQEQERELSALRSARGAKAEGERPSYLLSDADRERRDAALARAKELSARAGPRPLDGGADREGRAPGFLRGGAWVDTLDKDLATKGDKGDKGDKGEPGDDGSGIDTEARAKIDEIIAFLTGLDGSGECTGENTFEITLESTDELPDPFDEGGG